eukprot:CAMPEP_0119395958 /NCGR_PEP_ID=MMETSP1334-20130426/135117_1 /TAXON_ID=127549 /ORGANISM="Calcidiscus leptoporus, Strain RCC1130" /LENGTH=145 /DNA_ID=CAMNT_0007419535 /DNA_START=335 /DNA_END=768 /DNA_ORIENTATION=+
MARNLFKQHAALSAPLPERKLVRVPKRFDPPDPLSERKPAEIRARHQLLLVSEAAACREAREQRCTAITAVEQPSCGSALQSYGECQARQRTPRLCECSVGTRVVIRNVLLSAVPEQQLGASVEQQCARANKLQINRRDLLEMQR